MSMDYETCMCVLFTSMQVIEGKYGQVELWMGECNTSNTYVISVWKVDPCKQVQKCDIFQSGCGDRIRSWEDIVKGCFEGMQ